VSHFETVKSGIGDVMICVVQGSARMSTMNCVLVVKTPTTPVIVAVSVTNYVPIRLGSFVWNDKVHGSSSWFPGGGFDDTKAVLLRS